MNKRWDVACLGLIVSDILVKPVDAGLFSVDTTKVDTIRMMPGGDALNESIVFTRLGMRTVLLGKTGDDWLGASVMKAVSESGVDVSCVKADPNTCTTTSIVMSGYSGQRNFLYNSGNNDTLSIMDIDLDIIRSCRLISVGSIFELPGLEPDGLIRIFRTARESGTVTAADMTYDTSGLGLAGIRSVLPYIDILLPSHVEAIHLTGENDPEKAAAAIAGCGVKTVVIKLGAEGCLIRHPGGTLRLPAYKVPVADTTGAGDNFTAAFLTGLLSGWDMAQCGMFANAAGGICVTQAGATTAVKSRDQVLDAMRVYQKYEMGAD